MIALVHERLALAIADQTNLRLLEPPMPLQPIHLLMLWTNSAETDPGHSWLRRRIVSLVAELDEAAGPQRSPGTGNAGGTTCEPDPTTNFQWPLRNCIKRFRGDVS